MLNRFRTPALVALLAAAGACASIPPARGQMHAAASQPALAQGLVRVRSAYNFDDTIARIRKDVAAKGIKEFAVVPQSDLAHGAGVDLRPSTLILFGNPPLGTLFLTSNPNSGIDWPVRVLVYQDASGTVWAVYTDFHYLERRHRIADQHAAFEKADGVIHSIISSVEAPGR